MGTECIYSGFGPLPTVQPVRVLSPEEFAQEMRDYDSKWARRLAHKEMDILMCRVLRSLGYGEGVKVFLDSDWHYE